MEGRQAGVACAANQDKLPSQRTLESDAPTAAAMPDMASLPATMNQINILSNILGNKADHGVKIEPEVQFKLEFPTQPTEKCFPVAPFVSPNITNEAVTTSTELATTPQAAPDQQNIAPNTVATVSNPALAHHVIATPSDYPITDSALKSPVRPSAAMVSPFASPLPPPSAGKKELNDAAMALTWLAEALTGAQSPLITAQSRKYSAPKSKLSTLTTTKSSGTISTNGSRARRAASKRCSTVIKDTILNDRLLACNPTRTVLVSYSDDATTRATIARTTKKESAPVPSKPTPVQPTTAFYDHRAVDAALIASAERKLKGYSENSRVGRMMFSILDFIQIHQPEYVGVTPFGGVPERVIRLEFGNNPDTSKALRFLVSEKKIVRKGLGGRRDPYNYVLSSRTLAERERALEMMAIEKKTEDEEEQQQKQEQQQQEEEGEEDGASLHPSLTPAAAAALTAPSAGKWPATLARLQEHERNNNNNSNRGGKKPLQPRLSLEMAVPAPAMAGVKRPAAPAPSDAKPHDQGLHTSLGSIKKQATTNTTSPAGFLASVIAAGTEDELTHAPTTHPTMTGQHAPPLLQPAPQKIQPLALSNQAFVTPLAPKAKTDWAAWPSQLPSTQRLTNNTTTTSMMMDSAAVVSSPPFDPAATTTTTTPGAPVFLLPGASAALFGNTPQQQQQQLQQSHKKIYPQMAAQQAVTQAQLVAAQTYMLQLHAAQLLWKHQQSKIAGAGAETTAAHGSAGAGEGQQSQQTPAQHVMPFSIIP